MEVIDQSSRFLNGSQEKRRKNEVEVSYNRYDIQPMKKTFNHNTSSSIYTRYIFLMINYIKIPVEYIKYKYLSFYDCVYNIKYNRNIRRKKCLSMNLFVVLILLSLMVNESSALSEISDNNSKSDKIIAGPTISGPRMRVQKRSVEDTKELAGFLSAPPDIHIKRSTHLDETNDTESNCDNGHNVGRITLVSLRWAEMGVYCTITIFVIVAGLAKLAFHKLHWLSSKIPESCLLLALGVVLGVILYFTTHEEDASNTCHHHVKFPHFTSDIFFMILLPPIVLESAYSLHDRVFFDNIGTVLIFAVIGTIFNTFAIGGTLYGASVTGAMGNFTISIKESFVFSSLISAVDPVAVLAIFAELGVNKDLYFLVFGESLLNDGVTVVLYNTMKQFMSMEEITYEQYILAVVAFFVVGIGGIVIGLIFGVITALVTKTTSEARVVEPLATLGLAYLSYLTAELFHFSGIISLTVCGLVQAHYAFENVSQKTYTCVKYFTKMASATSDSIIFMFLGMVMVSDAHVWNWEFILWTLFLCVLYRFISVFTLAAIANYYRIKKINLEEQFIAAYGGLRGAVAFSLVTMLDSTLELRASFVTTTLVVILFTIFIQGATIKPLVSLLKIKKGGKQNKKMIEEVTETVIDHVMAGIEEVVEQHGDFYLREVLKHYDEAYMKKFLLHPEADNSLTRLYEKIIISEHYAHMYGPVALIEGKANSVRIPEKTQLRRSSTKVKSYADENVFDRPRTYKRLSISNKGRKSRVGSEVSIEDQPNTAMLRKAFRDHPYNKYHYTYNRNLVDESNQEIAEHFNRRSMNAQRMSRFAVDRKYSMADNSSLPISREENCHGDSALPGVPERPTTDQDLVVQGADILRKRHRMSSIRKQRESRMSQRSISDAGKEVTEAPREKKVRIMVDCDDDDDDVFTEPLLNNKTNCPTYDDDLHSPDIPLVKIVPK